MRNKAAVLLFLMLCYGTAPAQFRDKEWQISLSGYSINPAIPTNALYVTPLGVDTFSLIRPLSFTNDNHGICDTSGNLLFYTNGIWIANRLHDTLWNSVNFNPGYASTNYSPWGMPYMQYVLILPNSDSSHLYYIFNQCADTYLPINIRVPSHLGYSVIDMNLDGGLGGITAIKDSTLFSDTLNNGHMTACKHGNGRDWWVITHKYNSNIRHKILVTPQGPQLHSTQAIGQNTPDILDWYGQACFSPDGSKYALVLARTQSVELFDFDRCTGELSNPRFVFINDSTPGFLGCSFSPDSRFLYASDERYCYQFDTFSPNIDSSKQLVAVYDGYVATFQTKFFYHQLAADGKILISTAGGDSVLHRINQPDSIGTACDFQQHCIKLSYYANLSLNNFPSYNLGPLTGSVCDTLTSVNETIKNTPLQLKVFPNPVTTQEFNIEYTLEQNQPGFLEIREITGKAVYTIRLPQWSTRQTLRLPKLASGVYLVTLQSGSKRAMSKFVKMEE
ncbi:MAG: T9SS type A sorting domain-containing protein [Bacteroidia bacterium]|nr:T9SS type A sorting domain-containing protein [Bacteroidia bacterium]